MQIIVDFWQVKTRLVARKENHNNRAELCQKTKYSNYEINVEEKACEHDQNAEQIHYETGLSCVAIWRVNIHVAFCHTCRLLCIKYILVVEVI